MSSILTEEALAAHRQILPADINNYEAIKDTLLRQSGIHPHTHLQQLLQCSPKPGATATQTEQVLHTLQQGLTYDQFIDKLSLEITFRAAQPHIVHFVRALKHAEPQEAIDEMDQYIATRVLHLEKLWNHSNPKPKQPWISRHPNPFLTMSSSVQTTCTDSAQRPSKPQTQLSNTRKQTFTDRLPHKLAKYFDAEKGPMCFNCKKWGHLSNDCPVKQLYRVEAKHIKPVYVTGYLNEQPIQILMDSGAEVSVISDQIRTMSTSRCPDRHH